VGNDNNLGAIIRSAAFFDARYIILSDEDEEARLSTSAYRVAEGGMEHVLIRQVSRPAAFVQEASKKIITLGADHRSRLRISDLSTLLKEKNLPRAKDGGSSLLLILGNEETGLLPALKDKCRFLLRVPGTGAVESLNVAQAASLFLHEIFELG
jgi:TrmH RNA methyltransferase